MNLPDAVCQLFLENRSLIGAEENFRIAEWRIEGRNLTVPDAGYIEAMLANLPSRDKLRLQLSLESDPVSFSSDNPASIIEFTSESKKRLAVADKESVATLTITVTKTVECSAVSIYSLSAFTKTLKTKTFREQLTIFEPVCKTDTQVWVQLFSNDHPFKTELLHFSKTAPSELLPANRSEQRSKRSDLCHTDFNHLSFLPGDFRLALRASDEDLNSCLDDLCVCACLVYLADVTSATTPENISFKWNGYKLITGNLTPAKRAAGISDGWYKIYEWAYSGGGISDKIGLARNIMSLHWHGAVEDIADPSVYMSLRSSYEIYLKRNVEQYIAVKNKLNEYLTDFALKAAKLGEGLAEKFEKNVTAFVTFFITSILAKVLTDKSFTGVFNKPVATIGLLIICGSALHLWLSVYIFNKDRRWLAKEWLRLRSRYSDLLDAADLQRIFDPAKGYDQINTHLKSKRTLFLWIWVLLLIAAACIVFQFADWTNVQKADPPKQAALFQGEKF